MYSIQNCNCSLPSLEDDRHILVTQRAAVSGTQPALRHLKTLSPKQCQVVANHLINSLPEWEALPKPNTQLVR